MIDADVVIVGAGCAGLSLAWHLVEAGARRSVILVDPRTRYDRDRTFCYWNVEPHAFDALASHRWPRWRVRARGWIERRAPGIAYMHVPADRFYTHVRERLETAPGIELRLGVRAGQLRDLAGGVEVETSEGPLRARVVFDSRPPREARTDGEVSLLQHFVGWHVRTDRPFFDREVVTLMDFAVPQRGSIHFVYVLPFAADEALVEDTWFSPEVLPEHVYGRTIERSLEGVGYEILHREQGVLPMSTARPALRAGPRTYRIGIAGGMIKPSTGYAFQAIQRFSRAMARRLAVDELPAVPSVRPWRSRTLDAIFLSYLSRYPWHAPEVFERLFEGVEPALLCRFLSDQARRRDTLAVMRALPLAPFALEAGRSARLWLRA